MLMRWTMTVVGCLLILAGCASVDTRMTVEQLTNARVAVEAAEKDDAKIYAEDSLRRAQDALAIAKDAYNNQAFSRAFDFSKKATLYARIAKARTEQKKAEQRLAGLKEQLAKTKSQTDASMTSTEIPMDVSPTAQPQNPVLAVPVAQPANTAVPPAGTTATTAPVQPQGVTPTTSEGAKP
jgi:hypothetical protein